MFAEGVTFRGKENSEGDSVVKVLRRHEQWLAELQREVRGKVNKTDFVAGLSSKVSLSDITNISMDISQPEDSFKMNQSTSILLHSLQEQLTHHTKITNEKLQTLQHTLEEKLKTVSEQISTKHEKLFKRTQQQQKFMLSLEETKGDRSELDKIMHLSSLLAIEFQLIKKRFTTFETDYNLIWKEISNIYTHQQTIKNVIDTEQKSRQALTARQNNLQKKLFGQSQNHCVTNLFCSQLKPQTERMDRKQNIFSEKIQSIHKSIRQLKEADEDRGCLLKLFNQRLGVVQNYHENWFKSLKQIERTKHDLTNQKEEIYSILQTNKQFRQACQNLVQSQVQQQIHTQVQHIKQQIHEACQQITSKMVLIVGSCAKNEDIRKLDDDIHETECLLNQKLAYLNTIVKKHHEQNTHRVEVQQEKIKNIAKDLQGKLNVRDYHEYRKELITSQQTTSMLKKTQNALKRKIQAFAEQQKDINNVLCSQNVVCRWLWTQGVLKGGNLIIWDKEVVNTLPQNFQNVKNQNYLKIVSGGIYKIELGFYSKKKPTIQIIVNGQTVISAVNSNSYVLHHSSGKLKDISSSEVSGLTFYDFLTLPQNSRIAISYNGQLGHGFISLHRL